MYTLSYEMPFDAAHRLTQLPEGHKCNQVHGHTWKVVIKISNPCLDKDSFVIDFSNLKVLLLPLIALLDHGYLNDIPELDPPTCEVVSKWLYGEVGSRIPHPLLLNSVTVFESPHASITYSE